MTCAKWRYKLGRMLDIDDGRCFYDKPFQHLVCLGGSGGGKTTFMQRLIHATPGGKIVLDPTGDLVDKVCDDDWIYVSKDNPISINPLIRDYLPHYKIANELVEIVYIAVKTATEEQVGSTVLMQKLVRNCTRVGITDFKKMSDVLYEKFHRQKIDDSFWKHFDDKDGNFPKDKESIDSAKRLSHRLSLMVDDEEAYSFLTGKPQFSVLDVVENEKKYIFDLSRMDDFVVSFLGGLIANLIKSYYRNQAVVGGKPLFFFCDEVHYFLTHHFKRFFFDCRKYCISINLALHSKGQLSENLDFINEAVGTVVHLRPGFKADVDKDEKLYKIGLWKPMKFTPKNMQKPETINFLRNDWICYN